MDWNEIIEKLKQKAKSGFEVVEKSEALGNVPATVCDVAYVCYYCTDKDVCPFITEQQWVRLEDVQELIEEIKQNYVLVSRKKLQEKLESNQLFLKKFSISPEEPTYVKLWAEIDLIKELLKNGE